MTFDTTSAPTEVGAAPGASADTLSPKFWTTAEEALLRRLYPVGGAKPCLEALPRRTLSSIHARARVIGLSAPKGTTTGLRFAKKYPQSDHIDTAIREAYAHAKCRGDIGAAAARIGRPDWWVQKRASQLGVTRSMRTRIGTWTAPELALLEEFASCVVHVIAKKLREAGFKRTETAIAVQLKRRKFDRTDPDRFTAPELAEALGVNPATVADWIDRRGLKAEKHSRGPNGVWVLQRKHIRAWVAAHQGFIDLRKVDQVWFMDLAFG